MFVTYRHFLKEFNKKFQRVMFTFYIVMSYFFTNTWSFYYVIRRQAELMSCYQRPHHSVVGKIMYSKISCKNNFYRRLRPLILELTYSGQKNSTVQYKSLINMSLHVCACACACVCRTRGLNLMMHVHLMIIKLATTVKYMVMLGCDASQCAIKLFL